MKRRLIPRYMKRKLHKTKEKEGKKMKMVKEKWNIPCKKKGNHYIIYLSENLEPKRQ